MSRLAGVDAVIAPAPCESYPAEVPRAAVLGIPLIATRRAAGPVDLLTAGAEVEPFDVEGLIAAIRRVLDLTTSPAALGCPGEAIPAETNLGRLLTCR